MRVIDVVNRTQVAVSQDTVGTVMALAFSPDGGLVISATADGRIRRWDPSTGSIDEVQLQGVGLFSAMALSQDGRSLATGDTDGSVRLWDPISGALHARLTSDDFGDGSFSGLVFSPDGRWLASADFDGSVQLWDLTKPVRVAVRRLANEIATPTRAVAFSPNGGLLAADATYGGVHLYRTSDFTEVGSPLKATASLMAFDPAGDWLAVVGIDGSVQLWDLRTRTKFGAPVQPKAALPDGDVPKQAIFSPNGRVLAIVSEGGVTEALDVWDADLACDLARPYVTAQQVREYLSADQSGTACDLANRLLPIE